MKTLLPLIAVIGVIAFAISFVIRAFNTGPLLRASASGWWRGSMGVIAIGILFTLIELLKEKRTTAA